MEQKDNLMLFFAGKRIRKLLTIFVCLFIASVFWIFNALNDDYTTVVSYPIRFEYDKSKLMLMSPPPTNVDVAVSGYGWQLLAHTLGIDIKPLVIKSENLLFDKYITSVSLMNLFRKKFNSIKINHFMKDTLSFDIEAKVSKQVILHLDLTKLQLPEGKKIAGKVEITPNYLTCYGPVSEMQAVPDTISFHIPDNFIENDFQDNVTVLYHPTQNITQNIQEVFVKIKLK